VDAIIQECEAHAAQNSSTVHFYADDGFIAANNQQHAQQTLDLFKENFERFGVQLNMTKTETMTILGATPVHNISLDAYSCMITRQGPTDREK
jgi:Reverse transcriptase (RNA-dependent DNA polymerase)